MNDRQHRARRHALRGTVSVASVLALAGLMFTANARLAASDDGRHPRDLGELAEVESSRVEELSARVETLRAEVDQLADAGTTADTGDPVLADRVALAAGRAAVTGPGVTVALTDAPTGGPRTEGVEPDFLVVHQQDLQAVINALWAGGAEAMALQDQRVTATTAFRCVGNVLSLGGRVYSPPYEVRAIGDPDALREALLADREIRRYLQWVDRVGLGWSVTTEERLALPAAEADGELVHARVPEGVDVFPGGGPTQDGDEDADVTADGRTTEAGAAPADR